MSKAAPLSYPRTIGTLLALLSLLVMLQEWWPNGPAARLAAIVLLPLLVLLSLQVRRGRQMFVLVAALMSAVALITMDDGAAIVLSGLESAAFIGAFFCALATLRNAAETSPAVLRAGEYLARQPPGRRYLALSGGTQLFAPLLNYGAIALLGNLATSSARGEPNEHVREIRTRRMLLAIQRGFIATLPWSPTAFAVVITTRLIPGVSWADALLPSMISGQLLALTGWWLDRRTTLPTDLRPAQSRFSQDNWRALHPLLLLFALTFFGTAVLHHFSGVRVAGVVIVLVPLISAGWVALQGASGFRHVELADRVHHYLFEEMPHYRGELVLLMMAGFIGTVGAALLHPFMAASSVDFANWPHGILLLAPLIVIPVCGQIGMNPILVVSLFAPLLPAPAAMGLSPEVVMLSLTAGWMISGISSPFTATTLLTGSFAGVDARTVGVVWNARMIPLSTLVLGAWVLMYAAWRGPGA